MRIDQCEEYRNIQDIVDDMMKNDHKPTKKKTHKTRVKAGDLAKPEPYQELMNKENKMIELIEDIHQYKVDKENKHKFLLTSPLHVILSRLFDTVNDIGNDLRGVMDFNDIISILLNKERLVYTGIILVVFSIVLLLLLSL